MADVKISGLPASTTPLAGTEVLPIVQSGVTKKVANNDLRPKQIQSNATTGVLQVAGPGAGATRVMTTPDANFTVARTDAAQTFTGDQTFGTISTSAYAAISTTINRSGDFGQSLQFVRAGVAGNAGFGLANDNAIGFYTANTERWRVNSTGNLVAAASGLGIDFSATAGTGTSELLNDYEEGTWTPVIGGDATYLQQIGYYTKIGRLVTVNFLLQVNVKGTGSAAAISGLPYATANVGGRSSGSLGYWASTAINVISIIPTIPQAGGSALIFSTSAAASTSNTDSAAVIGNGTYLMGSLTYQTA